MDLEHIHRKAPGDIISTVTTFAAFYLSQYLTNALDIEDTYSQNVPERLWCSNHKKKLKNRMLEFVRQTGPVELKKGANNNNYP